MLLGVDTACLRWCGVKKLTLFELTPYRQKTSTNFVANRKKKTKIIHSNPQLIVKGQVLNKLGITVTAAEIDELRKEDKIKAAKILSELLHGRYEDLKEMLETKQGTNLQLMYGAVIYRALMKGDYQAADFLLNRAIGKVKEEVEHSLGNSFSELMEKAKEK